MGRPLSYNFLRERLLRRWKLKGLMTLFDLENNFFIVKFLLDDDMKYVLIGAPWQDARQYVTAERWKLSFNPKEEKITHMTAWVRINGLNVEFFRFDVFEKIGNLIGLTVKVDSHTMSPSRGNFLEYVSSLIPLTPCIEVEGPTYRVVYEGIQIICFECGHYGHGRDNFPLNEKAAELESMKDVTVPDNRSVEIENLEATHTKQVVGFLCVQVPMLLRRVLLIFIDSGCY
ncbi:hypothetical protein DKX38_024286 [Salix brachista]|uniref:DUF4283 domain-containing protein n=1 Tax=Salix brachista TaxID=2182728 RepID=A0A5N5JYR8_9ROSI|nr:hypothetical protein DKX38_024286 [Salix brachista]